jgi:isopenicillin-N epimerase
MLDRRELLRTSAIAVAAVSAAQACGRDGGESEVQRAGRYADPEWDGVRSEFALDPEFIHMSSLLISTHPRSVGDAVARYRASLDANPAVYLQENNSRLQDDAASAASSYLGAQRSAIALTDSTTMGLALVYNGITLQPGDEILTTAHDYYATHESLRLAAERTGARVRELTLFHTPEQVSEEELVAGLVRGITPATRVVALTWVHSGTGLKIPIAQIGEAIARGNAERPEDRAILLSVDGVHGFGIENFEIGDLNCDFFAAGVHKWMFGPRGTGILWGSDRGFRSVLPTVPSFMDDATWQAWISGGRPGQPPDGRRMSPGGFKPFEHQWAMKEAFEFHERIGKERVQERTHALAAQLKEGLAAMSHVRLITPRSQRLSSGIVCFEVDGLGPEGVVRRLREKKIVASITPYATPYARLTPSIVNTPEEVDAVLAAVRDLA